jgi:uncharacterized membrane protein YfcA
VYPRAPPSPRPRRLAGRGRVSGLLGLGGGIIKVPVLNTFCGVPFAWPRPPARS